MEKANDQQINPPDTAQTFKMQSPCRKDIGHQNHNRRNKL